MAETLLLLLLPSTSEFARVVTAAEIKPGHRIITGLSETFNFKCRH